jgi:predicted ester cyclase
MKPILAGVLVAAAACTPRPGDLPGRQTMPTSTEQNKATVRRLYEEASNHNDVDLMAALIDKDFVTSNGHRGPQSYAEAIAILRAGLPDIKFTVEDLFAEGDRVAIRWHFEGTHTGTFRGFPPTQKRLHNDGIAIYQLRGAKIVAVWLQTDRLGVLQQIGAVPHGIAPVPQATGATPTPPSQ